MVERRQGGRLLRHDVEGLVALDGKLGVDVEHHTAP